MIFLKFRYVVVVCYACACEERLKLYCDKRSCIPGGREDGSPSSPAFRDDMSLEALDWDVLCRMLRGCALLENLIVVATLSEMGEALGDSVCGEIGFTE